METLIRTTGKWILTGEHTVLRGGAALVFPFEGKQFHLVYQGAPIADSNRPEVINDLQCVFEGSTGQDYRILFYGLVDRCLELLQIPRHRMAGRVKISSDLPLGAGLGASAALCVAVVKWLHQLGYIPEERMYEMSRSLENIFHGESSGVDIAVALSARPLYFKRDGTREPLFLKNRPHLYLSDSGQKGLTQQCVEKVKNWMLAYPQKAKEVDQLMMQSVAKAKMAITEVTHPIEMQRLLKDSIDEAEFCFKAWGLTEGAVQRQSDFLKKEGALATKPTGSGNGGYILSLWASEPPEYLLKNQLIPCFATPNAT